MKRFFVKKGITAVLFIGILFTLSFLNWKTAYPSIKESAITYWNKSENKWEGLADFIDEANAAVNDQVYDKYAFIEGYGYLQELLLKKEINNFEVVKAKDGTLHYTYFTSGPNEVNILTERMKRLKDAASKVGSEVIYVMTPDKYITGVTEFEKGMPYNFANETADNFLQALYDKGIDTIDFRRLMKENGEYVPESFYITDHHWKVETAFWAFTKFVDVLEENFGLKFPNKDEYANLDNYNQIVYEDSYMGSMGRKEGKLYSKVEDFTFIYPKFDTNFYFYAQSGELELKTEGRFEQSLAFTSLLSGEGDIYDATNDKYFTYMDGNPGFVEVNNFNEPEGPKVLFIKDSLMVPVASFFSLGCSKVYMIDPRYYSGNIEEVIQDYEFDYIFVSYTPQNLTEEFFPFFEE
jgi:SGNH hydrolase-like domain, acetyltransferase AlgX